MSRLTGGGIALFVLVLATRALGQSALSVASITAVGKSFDRRVGVAMGVYSVLLSVLFAAAFTAVGTSVRVNGWRTAWAQVAIGLVLFAAPVVLFLRDRPARPASDLAEAGGAGGLSLAAALRTPAFWVFGGATSLFGLVSSGLGLFNQAVLAERGFDQQTYVMFLAGTSIIALVGQLACGWLTVHWSMQRLLGVAMLIYATALAALPLLDDAAAALDLRRADGAVGRHDHRHLLRGVVAGLWPGAPRPDPGRRADADGARVGDRPSDFREVRRADRIVRASAVDAGAVCAGPGHRGLPRHDAGPEARRPLRAWSIVIVYRSRDALRRAQPRLARGA